MRRHRSSSRRSLLAAGAALAAGLLAATPAAAQGWPERQVTLIVSYAAGGPSDVIGRLIAQSMSTTLGRQVLVENVAGAGGTAGAARAAKANADGYTILLHHVALAVGPSLYSRLTYDTLTAFEPIGLINTGPFLLSVKKQLGIASVADAVAYIRANKDKVTFGNAGVGSGSHLCNLLLQSALGFKVAEVAYRGTGPAMNDLVAGQIDFLFDQSVTALPQVQGNAIQGLAVTSPGRLAQASHLPTMQEAGFAGFEVTQWHALYAPAGTPKAALDRIGAALEVAMKDPVIVQRFADLGTTVFPEGQRGAAAAKAMLTGEVQKWANVMKAAGVKASD